ncbi:hypothetical protein HMPREF0372_03478 [Flavonifractor plautii ATCC 29863]|uniref:Uncharacterized protein n=1 Tax=Flavonifractor plautii ATCC 29863 TaxID=411475 RepID=G9YVB3_FLAPL|nr:hypothetical protein HMPREF0372_03478 [Flavonifractor plautii ATCC 29863]
MLPQLHNTTYRAGKRFLFPNRQDYPQTALSTRSLEHGLGVAGPDSPHRVWPSVF